ncbi:hypothetical protein Igag_0091 [Ignisphaera aggregans DSM 17230]|uniref:Uncharacterized protein n=1 Tax=Ignisphaera aggregans (strain DSM 17230 / JCM 13409 / AQ1.S1) TaxID=583356 RepID=E0SPK0_IGNAA|nr:hypothetical protein Igag_0091 [Ignisphaera aggregans DSM 17230]
MVGNMWFTYRKSPLGSAVRDTGSAILDFCLSYEDAISLVRELEVNASAKLKVINIRNEHELYEVLTIDPDIIDILSSCDNTYIVMITWK